MIKSEEDQNLKVTGEPGPEKEGVSAERRKAVAKMAYASPVIAGLLFSQRAAAQFSPPAPP